MDIQAVFFDSGHTLMRPVGDRWFPGARFFELAESHGLTVADDERLDDACATGYRFLDAHHDQVPNIAAELEQMRAYYEVLFTELEIRPPRELVDALAEHIVHDANFEPYPDTLPLLKSIQAMGLPMAVLTDAWPSTREKYANLGFLDFFECFVISAEEQCTKPDIGMFKPALDAIGVAPPNVLFIDDGPEIIAGAIEHGFRAHRIDIDGDTPGTLKRPLDVLRLLD